MYALITSRDESLSESQHFPLEVCMFSLILSYLISLLMNFSSLGILSMS